MSKKQETKITLTGYDELFTTQEARDDMSKEKVVNINIDLIDSFKNHPFKVRLDNAMLEMIESVGKHGILVPAIIRPKEDGRYEMVAGHRRMKCCSLAEMKQIPSLVRELSDEEATIIMVDSNLQREEVLPSEKAFAYKMKLEAMKKQGERTDLTSQQADKKANDKYQIGMKEDTKKKAGKDKKTDEVAEEKQEEWGFATSTPTGYKLDANKKMSNEVGESREQIRRYIRLTELVPELLQMVDDKKIGFQCATEVSYLSHKQQRSLMEAMEYHDAKPTYAQAVKMKKFHQEGKLNASVIQSIMAEERFDLKDKIQFKNERIMKLIPKSEKGKEMDFVVKALEFYNRHLNRNRERER